MTMTTAEIDALVHPPVKALVAETEDLCRHGEWAQAAANLKRLMRGPFQPEEGGYTEAQCHHALGDCAMNMGRPVQAIAAYRAALVLEPTIQLARENLIFLLDAQPETTAAEAQAERAAWWTHLGAPAYATRQPHTNLPSPEKRLRVGYVSADYRFHSAAISFSSVLRHHSEQIEPVFYSTLDPAGYDHVTRRDWRDACGPAFVDIARYHPKDLADIIRADGIDILVDLSGFTAWNRLRTFAYRPAPVQITAWGYATGVGRAVDVLFADPVVAPPAIRARMAERVVDLPCVIGFYPRPDLPDATPLPCLKAPPIFGVFQRAMKLNTATFATWTALLQAVPESRILFKGQDYTPTIREQVVRAMQPVQAQIDFAMGSAHEDHQRWYQAVDLALDPWPQTGGVSTMEAAWMGVPNVTLIGDRIIQRTSASILTVLGLPEFIAHTTDEYIAIAVAMVTTQRAHLADVRATLRARMQASPILTGYVEAVETRYRELWRAWCASQHKEAA
jgi:predicted O-linked N-acetylglucosamine transferase (SPINDLY family)